jgi:predicted MFS family arabinose efflux permease
LFSGKNFGSINGAMVMGFGVGGSIGPWLGGLIFDNTGEYLGAFGCVLAAIIVSVLMLWLAGPRQVYPRTNSGFEPARR